MTLLDNERQVRTPKLERPEYAAVPLDAWKAQDYEVSSTSYAVASIDRIREKAGMAYERMRRYDWVADDAITGDGHRLGESLQELIEVSLLDSQLQRLDRNAQFSFESNDPRLERARQGKATPAELLGLLLDHPELGSVELAKLSHPLDSMATVDMDNAVRRAIGEPTPSPARYKAKTLVEDIPAMTVLRKQQLANMTTPCGEVAIIRRQAFLVRGDAQARAEIDAFLDRKVKGRARHGEVFERIEEFLPYLAEFPGAKWLQPLATSYYAKNLVTAVKHRSAR